MKRREFIQSTMAGAVAAGAAHLRARANVPANDRIQLGCIGLGGMGMGDMNDFLEQPDLDVVAVCDVDLSHLDRAKARGVEKSGKEPSCYRDFRELLDRTDIDAVLVATPDHWHGPMTILACKAGKDVYVEKPLTHNVREGRLAVEAALSNGRITQLGTQVHSTDNYRRAAEIVRSGVLGPITQARVWIAGNAAPGGVGKAEDAPVPEGLDYDFWLGPAPKRPYNPNRSHFNWRYFWDYGGGKLGDFGCHTIDLVYWGMDPGPPLSVTSTGGRYLLADNAETPDTQEAIWDYAPPPGQSNPFQLVWTHTECSGHGQEGKGLGIKFLGVEGTLVVDYNTFRHMDAKGNVVEESKGGKISVGEAGRLHKREFLDGVRSRTRTRCDIEYAHRLTTAPLIGNVANRVGRKLVWDGARESFVGDAEADRLLTRTYRAPWDLVSLGIVSRAPTPTATRRAGACDCPSFDFRAW